MNTHLSITHTHTLVFLCEAWCRIVSLPPTLDWPDPAHRQEGRLIWYRPFFFFSKEQLQIIQSADPLLSLLLLTLCYAVTKRKLNPFGVTTAAVRLRSTFQIESEAPTHDDASVRILSHCWTPRLPLPLSLCSFCLFVLLVDRACVCRVFPSGP